MPSSHVRSTQHDIATDSLVNFETVKYFTAEEFEVDRFSVAVKDFQTGGVAVKASLSALNLAQQLLMQACLGLCLILSITSIRNRIDCEDTAGADDTCTGMVVGDFVAVLTYVIQLFGPLNFLGSVYNMLVMGKKKRRTEEEEKTGRARPSRRVLLCWWYTNSMHARGGARRGARAPIFEV